MQHFDFKIVCWQIQSGKHVPNYIKVDLVL